MLRQASTVASRKGRVRTSTGLYVHDTVHFKRCDIRGKHAVYILTLVQNLIWQGDEKNE